MITRTQVLTFFNNKQVYLISFDDLQNKLLWQIRKDDVILNDVFYYNDKIDFDKRHNLIIKHDDGKIIEYNFVVNELSLLRDEDFIACEIECGDLRKCEKLSIPSKAEEISKRIIFRSCECSFNLEKIPISDFRFDFSKEIINISVGIFPTHNRPEILNDLKEIRFSLGDSILISDKLVTRNDLAIPGSNIITYYNFSTSDMLFAKIEANSVSITANSSETVSRKIGKVELN